MCSVGMAQSQVPNKQRTRRSLLALDGADNVKSLDDLAEHDVLAVLWWVQRVVQQAEVVRCHHWGGGGSSTLAQEW